MTTPDGPDSNTAQLVQALKDNARRLGLTWQITMATVVDGSDPGAVALQFDGDDTTTPGAISTVGYLSQGERCYVVQVPPAGNYVMGRATGPYRDRHILTSTTPSVLFSGIPVGLRSVRVAWRARGSDGATFLSMRFRVNSVSAANYMSEIDFAVGASPSAGAEAGVGSAHAGDLPGSGATAGIFGSGEISFQSWDVSNASGGSSLGWNAWAQAMTAGNISTRSGGFFNGTGPYTSLLLLPSAGSFLAGSDFQLYGEPS